MRQYRPRLRRPPIGERAAPGDIPPSERAGSRMGSAARIDFVASRPRLRKQPVALRPLVHQPGRADGARGGARRRVVDAQHGKLEVGERLACAQHVERRPISFSRASIRAIELLRREAEPAHRFAERLDERLGARRAGARRLGHRLAPPFAGGCAPASAPGSRGGCAPARGRRRDSASRSTALRLGREQGAEEAVAVGAAHLVEHVAMRGRRRAVGRSSADEPRSATVERSLYLALQMLRFGIRQSSQQDKGGT